MDSEEDRLGQRILDRNVRLLKDFRESLAEGGVDRTSAEAHEVDLDFYLNHYLLYGEPRTAEQGVAVALVGDFFSNFFVQKAMWTDVETQKESIESLLLFYDFMAARGAVDPEQVAGLRSMIAAEKESWFAAMERYSETGLESWQSDGDLDFDSMPGDEFDNAESGEPEGSEDEPLEIVIPPSSSESDEPQDVEELDDEDK